MSSKLRDMAERLQQAPNVSEQMAKLDQMMTVGYDDYWKGRQPTESPFADFRGIQPLPQQPVQTQPIPDLTQPLLEPTTQEKTPETGSGWGIGETLKAFGKGAANFDENNEQRTAGMGMLWADFWQDRLGKKITDMAARDELTPEQYKQMKFAQRTPEETLWGENGLTIVADDDPRAKAAKLARTRGIITQSEAKRIDAARNVDMVFNRDLRARWAKFVEAAERGEIKLTDADENGRSVDPQKLYADFKRFERGNYEGVTGYRPKAGEMKLGDNEWAQEVGYNRRNERLLGWHEDAESRKNKNTYERGTPAYYMMMFGESAPDIALMIGGVGLARGGTGWVAARTAAGKAAEHAAERAAMRAAINAGVERTAAREMAAQAGKAAAQGVGRTAAANTGSLTGSAFIGEQVAAQAYADARASGLEPQAAAIYATWYGLAEAIPEKFALGKILRGNGTIRRQALRGMMAEAAQESVTQVLQNTADIKMLDRKMSLKEFLLSTLDAAVVGGLMGGTMGVVHGVAQKMGEAEQVNYADEWRRLVEAGLNGRQGGTAQDGTPPAPGGNPAPGNPTHPGGTPPVNPNPAPQGQGAAPPQAGFGTVAAENGAPDVANDELQEDLNELTTAGAQPWAGWFSPDEIAAIAQTDLEAALRISSAQRVLADPDVPESAKRQTVNDIASPADLVAGMRERFGDNIIGQEAAAQTAATPAQQQAAPQAADNPAPVNPVADSTAPQATPAGQAGNPAPDSAQQTVAGQQHIANRRSVAGMTAEARRQASQLGTTAFDARIDAMEAAYAAQEPTDPEQAIQAFNAASDAISQDMIQYARANGYTAQRSNSPGGFDWVKPNQTTPTPQPPQNPAPPAPPPQNPAPANPAPNTPPAPPTTGGGQSIIRANGREHGVTFEVREAASLTPATEAGTANQARNRASNAQSAAQVANIAANLDPVTLTADTHEMDTGMPTLARDGQTIIAGNGRTMAVQQAYAQHPERAQAYRQHLIDNAAAYGLDPAAIAQMQNPVLVRRFTDDVDVQQMATASNAGTGMALSAYELAATDAQALPADLRNLVGGTDGMIDPATGTNAAVMGQWAQALPENRRNAVYTQDGRTLSREGLLAFRNAVLYRAYGEGVDMGDGIISRQTLADIIENSVEELRNVRNALVNIAPRVVDMKARVQQGLYPAELDISADLLRASESLAQTRKANGPTVEGTINQQNLDGSSYPANAATLLRYFNAHIRSGADIRSYLNGYYDWANAQQSTNTADIFGAAPPTAAQGLAEAARAVADGRQLGAAGQANIHYSTPPQAGGFGISIPAGWPQDEHAEFAHPSLYATYRQRFGDDIVARLAHLQNLSTNPALPDETRVDALREQTAILNYFRNGGTRPDIPANPYAPPRKAPPPVNQATQQVATQNGTQHSNGNETLPPPQQRALPPGSQALPPGQTQTNTAQAAAAQEQTAAPDYAAVRRLLEHILGKRLAEKVTLSNTLPDGRPMPQEGAYLAADGTLIINPDAIRAFVVDGVTVLTREQRIAWVAWHEFVHRGADYYRQVWGGKEWQTTLSKLRNNSALRHLAEAIQAERNAAYLNSGQDVRVTPEQAMEEALAELAAAIQQGNADALIARYGRFAPTTGKTRLQALLGKMADVIRRVLGRITKRQITQEELSDADAIGLLRDITALQGADDLADAQRMAGVTARQTPPASSAERAVQRQERMAPVDGAAYSTPPDTLRKHTAATDLDRATETMLSNARSDGSRADTHSVDTIDDSTPQSATSQGVRHSTTPSLDEAADSAFARAVDDVVAGKVSAGYISLGTTPEVLKLIGVPDGKVRISGGTIEKAMASYLNRNNSYDENRHAIRPEDMKQLPAHLNAPIAVFKSATRADSFVVLTELMELENGRDKPVIAALHLQKGKRGLNLVDIASVYGRSDGQLVRAFDTDLLYLNKQKGRQFLTTHPLQLHWDITSDADLSARNIKTNEDLTQEKQTLQQEFEATAQQYGGAFDPADANIYHSTAPETGGQTPDARQQRTLRLASNRILNIARAIWDGAKNIGGEGIDFGMTPPVYQALGADALPLRIVDTRKLFSLLRPKSEQGQRGDNTHELTPELLAQIPEALQKPVMVFDTEQGGGFVAVTELTDSDGAPVVVAIHLNHKMRYYMVNKVASIYGKNNAEHAFAKWTKEGRLRYVDTTSPPLLTSNGVQYTHEKSARDYGYTVLTEADVVKLQQQLAQTEAETKTGQILFSTAWHGTPHRGIEKEGFKLHRIGTGEGAQSYGWGIYFAEERAVAEGYRARLSDDYTDALAEELHVSSDYTVDDLESAWEEYLDGLPPAAQGFMRELRANDWLGFDSAWDAITAGLNLALYKRRYGNELTDGMEAAAERYRQESAARNAGQVYKVDVPEKNDLLRYDGKEQSAQVQKILEDHHLLPRLDDYRANYDAETGTWRVKYYGEAPGIENRESDDAQRERSALDVRKEAWLADQKKGKDIYRALVQQYGSPKMASIALNSMGIPGLYYADGFSRGKKGGTSNFVIWDDALLTPDAAQIEAQYSVPPQLVTDPPTQAGLGKRIWQAFTDPTVRDLWFDRQGELDRILRADPNAEKVRNAFKMYNARVQHVLEGAPQTMIQDLGKALAAHYREAEKRIPALQNMKANKKVREQMFMEWLDGVGKYIYHGRERNAVILQRSKGKQTDGSGTDEAGIQEAERFFNSAEMGSGVLLTMYEDLYKNHLQPMMQMSDGYLRNAGLLTPEMEAARPAYQWYVPLFGAPQMEDSTIEKIVKDAAAAQRPNNGGASRTDVIRNRTHNAEGRHGTEAHNLFENIIAQMETAVRRAELQEPKRKLWAYLQTAEGARLFNATTSEYTINGGNRNTRGGRSWQKHTPDADEVVWQDGDTIHRMHIGNLRALEAIRDFNRQAFKYGANPLIDAGSWGLEQAGRVTRFMAGMYTRYNPSFVLRNKAMDSIQQWITLLADAPIGKETRAGLAGYADAIGNIASRLPVAAKAAAYNAAWTASGLWGRKGTDFAPWLERFAAQGGKTTYSQYFGRDKLQSLQDIMWAQTQGAKKWASLKHDFAALESMMTAINDHMELTTRVSAFRALVESGVSEEAAAVWAKDVMNFETKGDAGIKANALFPFFTTSLYDARRTFKALSKKEGQILFAALTGGFLALWQMLAAAGGEDDDGIAWVDKYPMSIAGRYAILPIPSDDGTMRGEGIRIPLGFGIARLANTLAVSTRRFTNGTDDGGRFASNLLNHGIISGFSPLQPSDVDISKDPAAWLVNTFSPQVVKPVVQLAMNKNYRGAPIYDDGSMRSPGELDYNSGYESTPDVYKNIVKKLYDVSGGSVDIAPETLQFLVSNTTGGAGQDVMGAIELLLDQTGMGNKSTASWYKAAPVLGGFTQTIPSMDRERYQQNKERVNHRYNQLVDAATRGKDYGKYQDAAYWHEYYKATEKQIRKLRKARKELRNSERLHGTDELRQRLRAIDGHILDIQKQANMKYREWEKSQ